jgi:gliding motility-associated-like protein
MMNKFFFVSVIAIAVNPVLFGQTPSCLAAFSLGPNRIMCDPQNVLVIQPESIWDVITLDWQLPVGATLIDSASVMVATFSDVQLIATAAIQSPNLIQNGDFSAGNVGFSSNLFHSPFTLLPPSTYAIVTNPGNFQPDFSDCTDHTSGTGRMFASNGNTSPNRDAWCQNVNVEAGGEYELSFWGAALTENQLAQLVFRIDGQNVSSPLAIGPITCVWEKSSLSWTAGMQTSVEVCIRNLTGSNSGNDFALDDIEMRQHCTVSDTVTITYQPQQITTIDTLICSGAFIVAGGQNFTASAQDTIVLQDYRGCDSLIIVDIEVVVPGLTFTPPEILNCQTTEVILQGAASYSGGDQVYTWYDPHGTVLGSSNNGMPIFITEPGSYLLEWEVLSNKGSCSASQIVVVSQDTISPVAIAGPDVMLTCNQQSVGLSGNGSSSGPLFNYSWVNLDGQDPVPADQLAVTASEAGRYVLQVRNSSNFCTSTDTMILLNNSTVVAGIEWAITPPFCEEASGKMEITNIGSGTAPFFYELEKPDGSTSNGGPLFSGLVPGDYTIKVTDVNGCSSIVDFAIPGVIQPGFSLPIGLSGTGSNPLIIQPQLDFPDSLVLEYLWSASTFTLSCPECPVTEVSGLGDGMLRLCLNLVGGCSICEETFIQFDVPQFLFLPTAFSPNGDGINDVFQPFPAANAIRNFNRFDIYDRWGGMIYMWKDNGPNAIPAWDGRAGGKWMDPGVYVFVLEAELVDGSSYHWKGEIFLAN